MGELNKQVQVMQARVATLEGNLSAVTANYGLLVNFVKTVAAALPSPISLPATLTGMISVPPNVASLPASPELQASMILPALSTPTTPPVPPAVGAILGSSGTVGSSLTSQANAAAGVAKDVKLGA